MENQENRCAKLADYYADCSNYSRNASTEHSCKLCEILVTSSLAFLAIVATFIEIRSDEEKQMPDISRWLLISGVACSIISLAAGIIHLMRAIDFFNRIAKIQGRVSTALDNNQPTEAQKACDEMKSKKNTSVGSVSLWVQVISSGLEILFIAIQACISILS